MILVFGALLLLVGAIRLFVGKQAAQEALGVVKTFFLVLVILGVLILLYFLIGYMTTGVRG